MMPRLDGIETTRALRTAGNDLPILVLTARDSVGDRVEGLDAGADDYLTKPFALEELLARLRALLRRVGAPAERRRLDDEVLSFSDLTLNLATREVRRGDRAIELTRTEFTLLEMFLRRPRRVLDRVVHPRGGLGLRLPHDRQLARGLRRLPAPQDRGRGRAAADPHRARRRVRAQGVLSMRPAARRAALPAALPPLAGQPGHPADHLRRRPVGGARRARGVPHRPAPAAGHPRPVAAPARRDGLGQFDLSSISVDDIPAWMLGATDTRSAT